ncbi:uncharacterized protein B0H18DRAFT_986361 [Fomitopsis serialis]|uniref:uncharacterized protein n=1 Tax=Fomitopsis serialis TaxID=139415 RepID=UPI002007C6BD|nr:uncharacterized protein B0H18DRAFT_986361 [Neoantrodia serialis]KAH9932587.1 hypothetical protein B0H18DRAFT_986361 [Neoantrodia serialis]
MLTALQLQTIHSIIDAVESEDSPSGLFHSSERKYRRAQYLTSQAHNILVTLRDEMNAVDQETYHALYSRLETTANFYDSSRYLQVAEEFWDFVLGVFQGVSYRFVTGQNQPGPASPPPPRSVSAPLSSPKTAARTVATPPPPYNRYPPSPVYFVPGWVTGWMLVSQ